MRLAYRSHRDTNDSEARVAKAKALAEGLEVAGRLLLTQVRVRLGSGWGGNCALLACGVAVAWMGRELGTPLRRDPLLSTQSLSTQLLPRSLRLNPCSSTSPSTS